jgi:hypothetical protein
VVDATILVEVVIRGDIMIDVMIRVADVNIVAHEVAGAGEHHGVVDAQGRVS